MGNRYASAAYREVGGMLREIRTKAGFTATQVAGMLGWPLTTISRMENGRRTSSTTDVIQYAAMCGMKWPDMQPLITFTRLAERKQGYYLSDKRIGGSLQSLIFHESSAENSIVYEPIAIHGLLQTPEYAQAHIASVNVDIAEDRVKAAARTRAERRKIMHLPKPARFTFFIHERALRLRIGSDAIMHEQLLHLVFTSALDHVIVRIVPSAAGAFGEAFRLMEFHEHRPIVYLDSLVFGGLILEDPHYVSSYYELVPMLADVALSEGQSREFAANLADAYAPGSPGDVTDIMAQEQLQPWRGNRLSGGCLVEPPTPIYE
jgi:transcriptional regulator with XRE-family HTH domain